MTAENEQSFTSMATVSKFAKMLDVSPLTVYRMLKSGRIHGIRINREWRIDTAKAMKELEAATHADAD